MSFNMVLFVHGKNDCNKKMSSTGTTGPNKFLGITNVNCVGTATTSRYNSVTFAHREAVITLLKEVLFSQCTKIHIAQLLCTQTSCKFRCLLYLNRATGWYLIYCAVISRYFVSEV